MLMSGCEGPMEASTGYELFFLEDEKNIGHWANVNLIHGICGFMSLPG